MEHEDSMYQVKHQVSRSLFALPPSLLRLIIQRAQQSQTATILSVPENHTVGMVTLHAD